MDKRIDTDIDGHDTAEDQRTAFQYDRRTDSWMDIPTDMDTRTEDKPIKQMNRQTY